MTPESDPTAHYLCRTTVAEFGGAISLLRECVGGKAGERLLVVSEVEKSGFYDELAPEQVVSAGRALGMTVYELQSEFSFNNESEKEILLNSLKGFDHIVFFSRVGDQIRFLRGLNIPPSTMCYTLDGEALKSSFGTACHSGMQEIKLAIDNALESASEIRVTCPLGSEFSGRPDWADQASVDVSLKRFPLSVPRPTTARGFTGRIVLSRFLVGTGSRYYEPYYMPLPNDVIAIVKNGRVASFEGDPDDVKQVENHYLHVAKLYSIDPWCVDSWHAGIHPGCKFKDNPETDMLRWSGSAFGNPRILHFHTCGDYAPGEISWTLIDPTVQIDGIPVWEAGRLYPERLAGGKNILLRHPNLAKLFENPVREIGIAV